MAGTASGKTFNTWPLMDGRFIPSGYWFQSPAWRNPFENAAAIQFNHRVLAYILLALFVWLAIKLWRETSMKAPILIVGLLLLWQVMLGIWTLLAIAPLNLSLLHQLALFWCSSPRFGWFIAVELYGIDIPFFKSLFYIAYFG